MLVLTTITACTYQKTSLFQYFFLWQLASRKGNSRTPYYLHCRYLQIAPSGLLSLWHSRIWPCCWWLWYDLGKRATHVFHRCRDTTALFEGCFPMLTEIWSSWWNHQNEFTKEMKHTQGTIEYPGSSDTTLSKGVPITWGAVFPRISL